MLTRVGEPHSGRAARPVYDGRRRADRGPTQTLCGGSRRRCESRSQLRFSSATHLSVGNIYVVALLALVAADRGARSRRVARRCLVLDLACAHAVCGGALRATRGRHRRSRIFRRRVQAAVPSVGVLHRESRTYGGVPPASQPSWFMHRSRVVLVSVAARDAGGSTCFHRCSTRRFVALARRLRQHVHPYDETFREMLPLALARGPALRAGRCVSCIRVPPDLAVHASARSLFRRSRLSVSSASTRSSELSLEELVNMNATLERANLSFASAHGRDSRCERSIHGWSLERSRCLRPRHRSTDGTHARAATARQRLWTRS